MRRYLPQRGTCMYTRGGAEVEVVEVVGHRVLVRQSYGCVVQDSTGRWVDRARLHWYEAHELSEDEREQVPHAWYGGRVAR